MFILSLSNTVHLTQTAAMVATALELGKRLSNSFRVGSFGETIVSGCAAAVCIVDAGAKGVLATTYPKGLNLGLILIESRSRAKKLLKY
jgi:predicted regulator of Ras-like GTPase activity (Roadblock/LC7/MglB family)